MDDWKFVVMAVGAFVLACFAASAGKWELVGTVITGYFALMRVPDTIAKKEIPQ